MNEKNKELSSAQKFMIWSYKRTQTRLKRLKKMYDDTEKAFEQYKRKVEETE